MFIILRTRLLSQGCVMCLIHSLRVPPSSVNSCGTCLPTGLMLSQNCTVVLAAWYLSVDDAGTQRQRGSWVL